jgi:hypothetical protein
MVDQLLWTEMLLKLSAGAVLLIAPAMTAALLGLPRPGGGFWPRLLGAILVGLGVASALQGVVATGHGLALGGSVAVNLAAAAFLLSTLILKPPPARRGRALLWLLLALLFLLSLTEIAFAGSKLGSAL